MPRSVDYMNGSLLTGLSNGTIFEVNKTMPEGRDLIQSHFDGETWGLAIVKEEGTYRYITSGDDNSLMLYDINMRKVIGRGFVDPKQGLMRRQTKKGGASSQSKYHSSQQSRALAYNHELNHLAVAKNDGEVSIRLIEGSENTAEDAFLSLDNEICLLDFGKTKVAKEWIECLRYNGDMTKLAVGSHDNYIYIFTCSDAGYKLERRLFGHSSYITCIDWSEDGDYIRSVCGAYELLFFSGLS